MPHEHRYLHVRRPRADDRRGASGTYVLNYFEFSNGYGRPDSWFESRSLRSVATCPAFAARVCDLILAKGREQSTAVPVLTPRIFPPTIFQFSCN